eukprot:scaffold468126_cov47-Prasinocladus_malaysianus.AAC.1
MGILLVGLRNTHVTQHSHSNTVWNASCTLTSAQISVMIDADQMDTDEAEGAESDKPLPAGGHEQSDAEAPAAPVDKGDPRLPDLDITTKEPAENGLADANTDKPHQDAEMNDATDAERTVKDKYSDLNASAKQSSPEAGKPPGDLANASDVAHAQGGQTTANQEASVPSDSAYAPQQQDEAQGLTEAGQRAEIGANLPDTAASETRQGVQDGAVSDVRSAGQTEAQQQGMVTSEQEGTETGCDVEKADGMETEPTAEPQGVMDIMECETAKSPSAKHKQDVAQTGPVAIDPKLDTDEVARSEPTGLDGAGAEVGAEGPDSGQPTEGARQGDNMAEAARPDTDDNRFPSID